MASSSIYSILDSALLSLSTATDPLGPDDNTRFVDLAGRTVYGDALHDRLLRASTSVYVISRIFRIVANKIALQANRIILDTEVNPLNYLVSNPTKNLLVFIQENAINNAEFIAKITRIYTTRLSPDFPESMSETQATEIVNELKTLLLDPLQLRIESSIVVAQSFRDALSHTMKLLGTIASSTINKWVHGVIYKAMNLDESNVDHTIVRNDTAAFLFGITYEYNSNEMEYNRMSSTIGHYLALHLDRDSAVIRNWQTLWTPTSIHAAIGLESTSSSRPWSTAMKYMASYADRTNISNILLMSELTYTISTDHSAVLNSDDRLSASKLIIDLMRTHAFLHSIRITRDVQENQASPLYGFAVYPYTTDTRPYDVWPSVCARVRKALRDREMVETLLNQMRGAIATGDISDISVPTGSCDTLMADEWENGQLAVALNGDRRPEVLVRVNDYERMLLLGTAENPFDRQEVKTVHVVRITLA